MNQLRLAYLVAKTQIGVREIYGPNHSPKVVEYHQACTLQSSDDETPWCSSFVNWCVIIAGIIKNPKGMKSTLEKMKYEKSDIDLFFASAAEIARKIATSRIPSIKNCENTGEKVWIGSRSAMARSWIPHLPKTTAPKEGDIVVLSRGSSPSSGHVGFVNKIGMAMVNILGGNQGNQVCNADYARTRVLSYHREP